jgi:hypothetical protein
MKIDDLRVALVSCIVLSGCSGAGMSATPLPAPQQGQLGPQSAGRQLQTEHHVAKPRIYSGTITDLVPPCGAPTNSCTGKFALALTRNGTAISGTWTEDFTGPPLHDQGTFSGTMTGESTFTASFSSPTDAPCTLTVTGTLTRKRFDAVYVFDAVRECAVGDHGTIVLRHGRTHHEGDGGDDGDDGGDDD